MVIATKFIHIGQTRRSFRIRFKEHLKYPDKSTFCAHLLLQGHDMELAQLKVITVENSATRLNVQESVEINKLMRRLPNIVSNEQLGPCQGSVIKWLDRL